MLRKDTNIEDAVVVDDGDVAGDGPKRPHPLHPQFALWLARGFLGIVIGAGVLLVRPGFSTGPSADVAVAHVAAPADVAAAPTIPARVSGDVTAIRVAALPMDTQSLPAATAVLIPNVPSATLRPETRGNSGMPPPDDLVIEAVQPPKVRSSAGEKSRFQHPIRRSARSSRVTPRPLTVIARGARRTVRAVGSVVSRLF